MGTRLARQVDSAGAVKWLRRAEFLARLIAPSVGVRRELLDGYIVEGRRTGDNRIARVMDLPGRFLPVYPRTIAISGVGSTGYPSPTPVGAPVRATMLEYEDTANPRDIELTPTDVPITYSVIGDPPAFSSTQPIGITDPTATPQGVVITRLVYNAALTPPTLNLVDFTINYTNLGPVFISIDRWGAGGAGDFHLLINEQVIIDAFGCPVILHTVVPYNNTVNAEHRAWATAHDNVVVLAMRLTEPARPFGVVSSIGVVVLQQVEGTWGITHTHKLTAAELDHPLFNPHTRVNLDTGVPLTPSQVSGFYLTSTGVASDGHKFVLRAVIGSQMDASATLAAGLRRGIMHATGILRCELDLTTQVLTHEITDVCSDAAATSGATDLAGELETTNGVVVSAAMSTPWLTPSWPVHCTALFDGTSLLELSAFTLGNRGDIFSAPSGGEGSSWRGVNTYRDPTMAYRHDTATWTPSGVYTETTKTITGSLFGITPGVAPGNEVSEYGEVTDVIGVEVGQVPYTPATYIGLGGFELPMRAASSTSWVLARIEFNDDLTTGIAPSPASATGLYSACYTIRTVEDDAVIPHKSTVTYRLAGVTVLQVRLGDEVFAADESIDERYPLGVFYIGNAFAQTPYGDMRAY